MRRMSALGLGLALLACGSDGEVAGPGEGEADGDVFVQPYESCEPETGVCTNVAISGCTVPGERFEDYADCEVVRTQRPYWVSRVPETDPADPRLDDAAFMTELAWVTAEIGACGCTCCHATGSGTPATKFDIDAPGIRIDQLSDRGVAIFSGAISSEILGAYPAGENNGFDRSRTGPPTTDPERMAAFFAAELERRGVTDEELAEAPPFGGSLAGRITDPAEPCEEGLGVDRRGRVRWGETGARYVYVTEPGDVNPGVPPNLDTPPGTLWRLDVAPTSRPLESGLRYGDTPEGTAQRVPASGAPPELVEGRTYRLYASEDVLQTITNCTFVFGD